MEGLTQGVALEPSPRTPQSGERSRRAILAAAERLFASNGFHGVLMPQIGTEAGVPTALVSYHFKSKLRLYRAVFRAHADKFTDARIAQLYSFRATADPVTTVRELLHILVQPVIEMSAAPKANEPREAERGVLAEFIDPVAKLIIERLEQAFPDVEKATVHWAFLFASGAPAINHAATAAVKNNWPSYRTFRYDALELHQGRP